MQTLLSSLLVIAAALYLVKPWLPHQFKRHFGKTFSKPSHRTCGACSSCGECESGKEGTQSDATKSIAKPIIISRQPKPSVVNNND